MKAQLVQAGKMLDWTADAAYSSGDLIQLPDGRAGVISVDVASGFPVGVHVEGIFKVLKTAGISLLKGGRTYWDVSAAAAYFRTINDLDFYIGRTSADAASAATTCLVELNVHPRYDIDASYTAGLSVAVGTAAAGGLGRGVGYKGAGLNLLLTATSEAQKIDWLSKDGFNVLANPIVEFAFSVPTGSAAGGTQDFNVGVASATHASDADAIAKHVFMHFDGNAVKINFQSKDGTTTVAATDSTKTLTAGQTNAAGVRIEVWIDFRDLTSVKFYVDGVAVLTGTTFDVSAWSTTTAFLLAHAEKTTGTDTFEADVDFLRARFAQA